MSGCSSIFGIGLMCIPRSGDALFSIGTFYDTDVRMAFLLRICQLCLFIIGRWRGRVKVPAGALAVLA